MCYKAPCRLGGLGCYAFTGGWIWGRFFPLGGALYNSPTEYKERLKNQSEENTEIKNSLNELGQRENVELSDFEKSIQKSMK